MAGKRVLLGVACCVGVAAAHLEDDSALVQSAVASHSQRSGLLRTELLQAFASGQLPQMRPDAPFDCKAYPLYCQAPFNCQDQGPLALELLKITLDGGAPDGELNFKLWCAVPMYYKYMTTCMVEKDLAKAGRVQFQWSLQMRKDTGLAFDEADASYCFLEGHCSNAAVTNATTAEDAVQMCDERYGRKGWAELGKLEHAVKMAEDLVGFPYNDLENGFHDSKHTTLFLKAACVMGNYHCDVMYCKETYCKDPYYAKRFNHLLPKAPGHLLQSLDSFE